MCITFRKLKMFIEVRRNKYVRKRNKIRRLYYNNQKLNTIEKYASNVTWLERKYKDRL